MLYFLAGTLALVVLGGWARLRAERELILVRRVSRSVFVAALLAFTLHASATIGAATAQAWPLAVPSVPAFIAGFAVAGTGAALYLAGRMRFRSFRLTWGLATDRLVTDGIYRYTRNPQSVGWLILDTGIAIAGRSGAALALSGVFLLALVAWLPAEERALQARFGEQYERYRRATPRIIGIPRTL